MGKQTERDKLLAQMAEAVANSDFAKMAEIGAAIKKLENEVKKAEKAVKAEKQAEIDANKQRMASELANIVEQAVQAYGDTNDVSNPNYIGEAITSLRVTFPNDEQTNTSCAINLKRKATGGGGNFNAGTRGDVLGTGMTMAQIVEAYGSDDDKQAYEVGDKNKRYAIVRKLVNQSKKQ